MTRYFFDIIEKLSNNQEIPYHLETKAIDLIDNISISEQGDIIRFILQQPKPSIIFYYFNNIKVLEHLFIYLFRLKSLVQNKKNSKNAFEHTLKVIDLIPFDDIDLRWCGLFHDLGKYDSYNANNNFFNHAIFSSKLTESFVNLFNIEHKDKIISVVSNHMYPLDYQRTPDWTDEAIIRFINRCNKLYVIDVVNFAYYDKKSENDYESYLKPIIELRNKIKYIIDKKSRD